MLGVEISKARRAAGLTQEALALRANVDRTYISQLEHDHKSPTIDMLFRLCEAMNASAAQIVRRIENRRSRSTGK